MALSEKDISDLLEAREARRTEEFLAEYRTVVETSRVYHERLAERQEPTPERMSEVFNF